MQIVKNGIYKTIEKHEWLRYKNAGFKKAGCLEPQPSQEGLYVIDDYTIGRLDNIQHSIQS